MQEILDLTSSLLLILGIIFAVYRYFRNPDIKASDRLNIMERTCGLKHSRIDEIMNEIRAHLSSTDKNLMLLKENDIKHIEAEMWRMSEIQTKILAILEYKEGQKIQ